MKKKLILMVVYDNGDPKAKCEMFVSDNFKDLYKKRKEFKERTDITPIKYEIYQMIEDKLFTEEFSF